MTGALVSALLVTIGLVGCQQTPKSYEPLSLTVAHVNDTHSHFDPMTHQWQAELPEGQLAVQAKIGGYPRLAQALMQARRDAEAQDKPFLALHGGDAFQGTLYFSLYKGLGNQLLLNEFGLDAMVIGNHEFDLGEEPLLDFVQGVNFPVLAANMTIGADSALAKTDNIKPYIVRSYGPHKVGVFGLVLQDLPELASPGEALSFEQEVIAAQATVDELKAQGINHIIMLSHIGLDRDLRVARSVNGVDLIVGGHTHTLMGNFYQFGMGHGPGYAELHQNPDGGQTCVVQAGEYAHAAGLVEVNFDIDGNIAGCQGGNELLFDAQFEAKAGEAELTQAQLQSLQNYVDEHPRARIVEEHPKSRQIIDEQLAPSLSQFSEQVIAQINDENDPLDTGILDHVRIPGKGRGGASLARSGSEGGAVVANAFAWKVPSADMVILNSGGVRAHLQAQEQGLTAGYVLGNLLPFGGTLSLVSLKGEHIKLMLEQVINQSTHPDAVSDGGFPITAKMTVSYDGRLVEGQRITQVQHCPKGLPGDCLPLEDERVYSVLTSTFLAGGKDGYDAFVKHAQAPALDTGFVDNESMIEYAKAKGVLYEQATGMDFVPADFAKAQLDVQLVKPQDNQASN
ncbi:bifunctional metallophosphatase/5'-nucleotidase [Paraferrimonas sedimenticola]|uniref:Bifunctional metallophosphatase/5'-nucleotidase n=2 Tax=Paraferrimonas sedimenticola TaxID=375674 RepID=A0AA37RZ07_9GAMM|nr:bifunctional metallophosphatase/5'-nucleotidase [Paraferrimonas sedimenticola]